MPKNSKREWSHPDGKPLADFEVGVDYEGVITNVVNYGVFVDIGAVTDALIRIQDQNKHRFRKGEQLKGLKVAECDEDEQKILLTIDADAIPDVREKGPEEQKEGKSKTDRSGEKGKNAKKDWGHADGKPLDEFSEGHVVEGTVTNVSTSGVFVDIGAAKDARLDVKASIGRKFRVGDIVEQCEVASIDAEKGRMAVKLQDIDAALQSLPEREPKQKKTVPKAKSKAKAKAPRKTHNKVGNDNEYGDEDWDEDWDEYWQGNNHATPGKKMSKTKRKAGLVDDDEGNSRLEQMEVGDTVDGVVVNKSTAGVFVDIGCGKDARLSVPRNIGRKFAINEEIFNMIVESVELEPTIRISVELSEEDLADKGDEGSPSRRQPRPKAKAKAKPKAKGKADQTNSWRHPGKRPVSRYEIGQSVDGIVTYVALKTGAFINIGAVTDGVLKLSSKILKDFRVGDEVYGMLVEYVDLQTERIYLSLEEPELEAAEKWEHPDGAEISEFTPGDCVDSVVTNTGRFGIFVDIGAVKDAKLLGVPKSERHRFRIGDAIKGAIVETCDAWEQQISVTMPGFDSQKEAPHSGKGKGKGKGGGKGKTKDKSGKDKGGQGKGKGESGKGKMTVGKTGGKIGSKTGGKTGTKTGNKTGSKDGGKGGGEERRQAKGKSKGAAVVRRRGK